MNLLRRILLAEKKAFNFNPDNNRLLKILSFFIAFILFLSINNIGTPFWQEFFFETTSLTNVPLEVEYPSDEIVMTGIPQNINVSVKGTMNEVQAVEALSDNLIASLDVSTLTSGEHRIDTKTIKFNSNTPATIVPDINTFDVIIQDKTSKKMPADINYIKGNDIPGGLFLGSQSLSSEEVLITGGSGDVDSVVSVRGQLNVAKLNTATDSGVAEQSVTMKPYNADGNVVNNVDLSPNSILVNQDFEVGTAEIPVAFEFTNIPTGKAVQSLCLGEKCEDITVEVYGDINEIQTIKEIVYPINVAAMSEDGEVLSSPSLAPGIYMLGEIDKSFTVTLGDEEEKKIEDVEVNVTGLADDLEITNEDELKVDVLVKGEASLVTGLDASNIELSIDLSEIDTAGELEIPIVLNENNMLYYELPEEKITLNIEKKE